MAEIFLLGGGWTAAAAAATYGRFVAAAGTSPTIACVLLDEPGHEQYFQRFADVLAAVGADSVHPVVVGSARRLELSDLSGAGGVFVAGGLTPAYLTALADVRLTLGPWLAEQGVPYAGFSAGAAVAASTAVVGGWKMPGPRGAVTVCPEEVAEDLVDVAVTAGLGLVPFAVDVHASAWGTLSRLLSVVAAGHAAEGWAIDEDTMLAIEDGSVSVHGAGRAYHVRAAEAGVAVQIVGAGVPAGVPAAVA